MNRRTNYSDNERYLRTCAQQKRRQRAREIMPAKKWTMRDDIAVLTHEVSDNILMKITGHSKNAIRVRRRRLRRAMESLHYVEICKDNYEGIRSYASSLK